MNLPERPGPRPVEKMPEGYTERLADVAVRVRANQYQIACHSNEATIHLYWSIGRDIVDRRQRLGWGTKVIERLSADLREELPGRRGFSPTNLDYMRRFVLGWPTDPISQQLAGKLPS
jgi:hypothetical protein